MAALVLFMHKYVSSMIFLFSGFCLGDSPLPEPEAERICDYTITYCADVDPNKGTTVYRVDGSFESINIEPIYKIPGWHRSAWLTPRGVFISGYPGLSLVPLDVQPDQVILTIWNETGDVETTYSLGQILKSLDSLERTASHYDWGRIERAYHSFIHLETVEGTVLVHFTTNEIEFRH